MPTTLAVAEEIVSGWLAEAGDVNPAGPLYASGMFAEADIIDMVHRDTHPCSSCTASTTRACC